MSYSKRVVTLLVVFLGVVFIANGWLVKISHEWASDDLHAGKGSVGFPPQTAPESPASR